jgi:hypothetical protein
MRALLGKAALVTAVIATLVHWITLLDILSGNSPMANRMFSLLGRPEIHGLLLLGILLLLACQSLGSRCGDALRRGPFGFHATGRRDAAWPAGGDAGAPLR